MSGSTTEDIPRLLALARVGDRTAVGRLLGEYRVWGQCLGSDLVFCFTSDSRFKCTKVFSQL
jgi:hypothetical protein